jgi:hypothetical protein
MWGRLVTCGPISKRPSLKFFPTGLTFACGSAAMRGSLQSGATIANRRCPVS